MNVSIVWMTVVGTLIPALANANELDCIEGVCIELERAAAGDRFFAINRRHSPATLRLGFPVLENLSSSEQLPIKAVIAPNSRRALVRTEVIDPASLWRRRYQWHWRLGVLNAVHDPVVRYRLPIPTGRRVEVVQSVGGSFSHVGKNRHSFDFALPVGTPVHAARNGVVVEVVDRHRGNGMAPRFRKLANWVAILHDDGTLGRYVHLQHRGARVQVGETVRVGEPIAWSGNSGRSSLPHLHFSVVAVDDALDWSSVPIRFADGTPTGFVPVTGQWLGGPSDALPANAAR